MAYDRFDEEMMHRDRHRGHEDRGPDRGAFFRDRDDRGRGSGRHRDREWGRRGSERHYGSDDYSRGLATDETERLIASNKVEGTAVYDRSGDKIGTVHNFMVDKLSGQVQYAVLRHSSGFLGLGERYYPIEWDELDYDTERDGYRIGMTENDLRQMSGYDSDGRWRERSWRGGGSGRDRGRRESGYDRDRDSRW